MIMYGFVRICISQLNTIIGGNLVAEIKGRIVARARTRTREQEQEHKDNNKLLCKERRHECEIEGFFIELSG